MLTPSICCEAVFVLQDWLRRTGFTGLIRHPNIDQNIGAAIIDQNIGAAMIGQSLALFQNAV